MRAAKYRAGSFLVLLAGLVVISFSVAFSQTDENTDLWRVRGNAQYGLPANTGTWHGDSLWVGATFMRDTTKKFVVWLANYYTPQGTYHGALYLMVPRPGLPDSAVFLFYNKCNGTAPTSIDLTNITPTIHHLDTLFFMYRSFESNGGGSACGNYTPLANDLGAYQGDSLFTGPNRAPGEGWINIDRHYSARSEATLTNPPIPNVFYSLNQQGNVPYGRRWCEAGWVHTVVGGNIRTDTVEFGFEDQFNGRDINYEDIRFNITGVFLIHPLHLNALFLDLFPPKDTIPAGDSISYLAVLQGSDSLGRTFRDSTDLATKVVWGLKESTQSKSVMAKGSGPSSTNTFRAVTAFERDTITASYTDQAGNVLTRAIPVWVSAGKGTHVVIEADSLAANTRSDRPIDSLTVDRTAPVTVYAVVRDAFGNFVNLATNATWQVTNPSIASATPAQGKSTSVSEVQPGTTTLTASVPGLTPGSATITTVGPTGAIPVTAILLDTNGDGHLDRIDIVFPDSVKLLSTLPSARLWVLSAGIISDDGNSPVNLVIDTLLRGGGDTIHVILRENTGPTLETGWPNPSDAHVTLSSIPVTTDQRAFVVTNIIDGASPVIKNLCFVPADAADTLRVYFSSPVTHANMPGEANTWFTIQNNGSPIADSAISIVNQGVLYLYVYKPKTLTDAESVKEGTRPLIPIELCGDVSIVTGSHVASNPFTPGKSIIPSSQQDQSHPVSFGTRIEVSLIRAIQQDLQTGKVSGTISIFDAVGNTIIDRQPLSVDAINSKLFKTWDGKTRKGGYAGGGTYMAKIVINDEVRSRTQSIRQAIGIRQ